MKDKIIANGLLRYARSDDMDWVKGQVFCGFAVKNLTTSHKITVIAISPKARKAICLKMKVVN